MRRKLHCETERHRGGSLATGSGKMSAGIAGLRVHRSTALAGGSSQYRHFIASSSLGTPAEAASATTPEAAAAEVAAKKTGRAVYWFIGVAAAAVLGTLAYPQLVTLPPQKPPSPLSAPPPVIPPPSVDPPPAAPIPTLSPREELEQRLVTLRSDLAELRKQKRSQLVDMKKRSIKDEIIMIESGLKKLDKA